MKPGTGPSAMVLVMVGDFDLPQAASAIQERFASLTARRTPQPDPDPGQPENSGERFFSPF